MKSILYIRDLLKNFHCRLMSFPLFVALCISLLLSMYIFIIFQDIFIEKIDINIYAQKYANSQYVKGEASTHKISDAELYIYAGYAYMQGEDPTTINFEHPPLFKYLFGISFIAFGNPYIISLIYYSVFIFCFYLFSGLILKKQILRYSGMVILGLQPFIYSLAGDALLDLPLNILILLLFYFLFKNTNNERNRYIVIAVILGLLSSVKYPFPFILLPVAVVVFVSFYKKTHRYLLYPLLLVPTLYLLQYTMFFAHNHTLIDFILFEKYRFVWWTGARTMPKFLIFQNLFTGQYPAWWEENLIMKTKEWNVLIPTLFFTYLASFILNNKYNLIKSTLFIYSITLLLLYGFGSAVYLRYLSQIMPFWIVITLLGAENLLLGNSIRLHRLKLG